ncbi:flagella protein [Salinadaptatus halalkaliphilus]|uniref:Flagella protein n=1 Tax=Salinadaptatus halalkaliphilus TaxID=2419781 RepID=A0A4S3TG85_9EURY|nr:FlaD/FlaE family flagellar protein [Salinadaptatus halalkaliphilus]THE62939.1 flagella protein [Salinadaptatus halalkaliphilus]
MVLFSEIGGDPDDETEDGDDEDDLLGGAEDGMMGAGDDMFGGDDDQSDDDELNYRLDEIEKEIDGLQGKVETVRGENEQISDSIESVERNVDKLVDMYEIVTHGVNPFAADQEIGDAFETATGQDGLIGADDEDEIDPDIAGAEAEDFLGDDLPIEDESEDDFEDVTDEPADDDPFADDPLEDEPMDDETLADDSDEPDDDIEQFLPGEDDESFSADGDDDLEDEAVADDLDDDPLEGDADPLEGDADDLEADDGADDPFADDEDEALASEESLEADDAEEMPTIEDEANGEMGSPPYLASHPSRPDAEITTLDWLAYLVETAGVDGAAQTIAYYESIDWIAPGIETYLHTLLAGFGEESTVPEDDPEPRSGLSTDEHKRSLAYISAIATPEKRVSPFDDGTLEDAETPSQ